MYGVGAVEALDVAAEAVRARAEGGLCLIGVAAEDRDHGSFSVRLVRAGPWSRLRAAGEGASVKRALAGARACASPVKIHELECRLRTTWNEPLYELCSELTVEMAMSELERPRPYRVKKTFPAPRGLSPDSKGTADPRLGDATASDSKGEKSLISGVPSLDAAEDSGGGRPFFNAYSRSSSASRIT